MREPGEVMVMPFPRPGRALKAVLAIIAIVSLSLALLGNWLYPPAYAAIIQNAVFTPQLIIQKPWMVWTLVTSGVITVGLSHVIFTLIGLYFLSTDLERRWGGARFIRFLVASVVLGNLVVLACDLVMPRSLLIFHPTATLGAGSAIAATAIAWSRMNAHQQIRLFFFLPISGRMLFYITLGFCVLGLVYHEHVPEGAMAPFGGVAVGYLLSSSNATAGSPSALRTIWLKLKLAMLRRRGAAVTVDDILEPPSRPRPTSAKRKGGPPLRVVPGGLEDELKNRKPPKDKRYLN
jgi:membrane associated rhomboid family serine protease